MEAGVIRSALVTAFDRLINASTVYTFSFVPVTDIPASTPARIQIDIPPSVTLTNNACSITARSSAFSNRMSCNAVSSTRFVLSYVFSNRPDYTAGTLLSVSIGEITNANSVRELGDFVISIFIQGAQGNYYLQN